MSKHNVTIYEVYPENKFRLLILPLQRCGHDSVRVRAEFVDSVARHRHNLQTFERRQHIVLCL